MSDASLPNTTLRQRFDAFIAANTHKKASETDFRRKGSLGVGLIITDTLMSKPPSFPLNPDLGVMTVATSFRIDNAQHPRRADIASHPSIGR